MTNSNYYVLLGGAEHLDFFENNADYVNERWYWTVPKNARTFDIAFVYLCAPVSQIVGEIQLISLPFYNIDTFPQWADNWMAEFRLLKDLSSRKDLHIKNLKSLFPDWTWLRYPRGKTRIPSDIIMPFLTLTEKST